MSEFRDLYTLKSSIGLSQVIEDTKKKLISEFVKKLEVLRRMVDDPDDAMMVKELKEEYEEKL